jgi:hypothetical protein
LVPLLVVPPVAVPPLLAPPRLTLPPVVDAPPVAGDPPRLVAPPLPSTPPVELLPPTLDAVPPVPIGVGSDVSLDPLQPRDSQATNITSQLVRLRRVVDTELGVLVLDMLSDRPLKSECARFGC